MSASGDPRRPGATRLLLRLSGLEPGPCSLPPALREFHVSRASRDRCQFDQALFALSGNVVLVDFPAVRLFAQRLNERSGDPLTRAKPVQAGALNAMGLIDEILHYVAALYSSQARPGAFRELAAELERTAGPGGVRQALLRFCGDFPPLAVYQGKATIDEYLQGTTDGVPNLEIALEELLLLWLANVNPAFSPFRELFDDGALSGETAYTKLLELTGEFFSRLPPFGPQEQSLVEMLRSPALAFPDSLSGQLQFIREKWGLLLGRYADRLLTSLDLIREDEKKFFAGPAPAAVFEAGAAAGGIAAAEDVERFSSDRDWMPRLVLLAKTVHVWLDQLEKKHGRPIRTLDQIPDEELDRLAAWGFTGLWLIGVWERSPASRLIKLKCGNPEAMASAYSLYRYEIAADLGGDAALEDLKARAWSRGIRLASDMVPNHMGIDSPWVVEHPEWFIALDQSPFPSYRFTGEDLSSDPRVGIYLEDHYYDRSDAAVVFKWVDRRNGSVRYIYHGNDGTRMPWNDTAQLNYLRPDVREAVVQTILDVARRFPIIRFDAAMTLTRRHYQRLWFPPPGSGGDIPTRSGQGMRPEHFNRVMPWEFWREVVDRMAAENPNTLLLAEAFWLMESYFVRTLGMHRVYNSAFMNFLKMEENAKFRLSLKNVLEFNPEILKRFVNFMNNPDEETAVAQFGDGDKYFGACTLLAALPGLPMFGHGQLEGFREKYGMEYKKAYLDERPNDELLGRHERQIFPLLRRRALFAGVEEFLLYDFYVQGGEVDENVIAFSNSLQEERALVLVHNCFAGTAGWIRVSAAFSGESPFGGPRTLMQKDLGWGLGLRDEPGWFVVFRDLVSGLEYIRSSRDLHAKGMFFRLSAYQTHVFLDFRELADDAGNRLARLEAHLGGNGCVSLETAGKEMELLPLHDSWRTLCRRELMERLIAALQAPRGDRDENQLWLDMEEGLAGLMRQVAARVQPGFDAAQATAAVIEDLLALRSQLLPSRAGQLPSSGEANPLLRDHLRQRPATLKLLLLWIYLRRAIGLPGARPQALRLLADEWQLEQLLSGTLRGWGTEEGDVGAYGSLLFVSSGLEESIRELAAGAWETGERVVQATLALVEAALADAQVRQLVQVNPFQGRSFFNRERFDLFCDWLAALTAWQLAKAGEEAAAADAAEVLSFLPLLAGQAGYDLDKFLAKLKKLAAG